MEKTSSSLMKNSINIKEINSSNNNLSEADFLSLFSWPPRSYTCTFCKREFRSAQALGGHMNVHRRDRARLRQSPPHLNLNLHPNPSFVCFTSCNPSFLPISSSSSSSTATAKVHQSPMIPPSVSTISTTPPVTVSDHLMWWGRADFAQDLMARRFFELENLGSIMHENGGNLGMENSVKLELISEVKEDHHVDLELRLGYV